ncbi:GntR family transcriptional regulator [Jiangella rhizosphaerae]|uniref:GntR family transcriptional regulator n=1 Tax=Jiangella rhizosphaerae TaxID=2293569 RepID=A0A418KNZ0_9ACTN|nr:GntR family transcriptional regulator [Jiangella rhizosphaerae]RIQ21051.1 GntR family transcriptional regulator [Jiangella rhizosphaerae]
MADFRGRPAYLQIADDIRSQILDGTLQAEDRLPSEADLMADYGVSRIVVRNAVEVLRSEGLVVKQQGRGSFVRAQRPQRTRVVGDLYSERPEASPFAASARASGQVPEWEYQTRRTTASKTIADRLGIQAGDPVMRTSYRFFADGEPAMLSTSFEPLAITEGTPVEQPEGGSVTGVVPRMDAIGIHITHVVEDVTGRSARPYEAETLKVPVGVPVLAIERTYYAKSRPIETADIVVSSDRYVLSYRLPVPPRTDQPTPR